MAAEKVSEGWFKFQVGFTNVGILVLYDIRLQLNHTLVKFLGENILPSKMA